MWSYEVLHKVIFKYKDFYVFANLRKSEHKSHVTQYGPYWKLQGCVEFVFRLTKIGGKLEAFLFEYDFNMSTFSEKYQICID